MSVKIQKLSKAYGSLQVCKEFSLELEQDKIHCFLGPSGCGKTTLLHILSGILAADQGSVFGIDEKKIAYIFQEERLLPWYTVEQNIHFVLKGHYEREEILERTAKALELVDLKDFSKHFPHELSGGMKQRVSFARAFAYGGEMIIMDEPFKGLHRELKFALMDYVKNYYLQNHPYLVFVTHDQEEAMYLGDKLYYLSGPPLFLERVEVKTI